MLVFAFASNTMGAPWPRRDMSQVVLGNLCCSGRSGICEAAGLLRFNLSVDLVLRICVRSCMSRAICVGSCWSVPLSMVSMLVLVDGHQRDSWAVATILRNGVVLRVIEADVIQGT